MDFSLCKLYGVQTKKQLLRLLNIQDRRFLNQAYCVGQIRPVVNEDKNNKKQRLIEISTPQMKKIQFRIKNLLQEIVVDPFVFSGTKGVSYPQNALHHVSTSSFVFKTDLTGFFPSISREAVFRFFQDDLAMSPDTASVVTNFLTIDLEKITQYNLHKVYSFLENKGIACTNHLITGSSASTILSYLVNHEMFNLLNTYSREHGIVMSVYVDDLTFSSEKRIPYYFRKKILHIITRNGFIPAKKKTQYCDTHIPKLVTGVILDQHQVKVPNKLRKKAISLYVEQKINCRDIKLKQSAQGVLNAARQIESDIFPSFKYNSRDLTKTKTIYGRRWMPSKGRIHATKIIKK